METRETGKIIHKTNNLHALITMDWFIKTQDMKV